MEMSLGYPDSPGMEPEEDAIPCKGCGEVLEEGKAFELAGHRWHIDCFRCNTCRTLLDSDANLLLLGDGSLVCNNCTYSCSACGQKIEDLAILTGDQAYCAGCFKCRNCKKQIENLRYARTSQGMFCMECHDALMARRRKKSAKTSRKPSNNSAHLDKSLPLLPPSAYPQSAFSPDRETPPSGTFSNSDTPTELPGSVPPSRLNSSRAGNRDVSPATSERGLRSNLTLPSTSYRHDRELRNGGGFEPSDDFIPMALDPHVAEGPSPMLEQRNHQVNGKSTGSAREQEVVAGTDYFNIKEKSSKRKAPREQKMEGSLSSHMKPETHQTSPHIAYQEKGFEPSHENFDPIRRRKVSDTGLPSRDPQRERSPHIARSSSEQEKFKLQDAPKRRKSSIRNEATEEQVPPALDTSIADTKSKSAPASAHPPLREQHVNIANSDSTRNSQLETPTQMSPRMSSDFHTSENPAAPGYEMPTLPKRGDSLQKSAPPTATIPRKEIPNTKLGAVSSYEQSPEHPISTKGIESSSIDMYGGKVISRPMESPVSKSALDFPSTIQEQNEDSSAAVDSFVSPRAPPPRPTPDSLRHKVKNTSVSSIRSESARNAEFPSSPSLPRFSGNADYITDEAAQNDEPDGFFNPFRRVSKSVRHARSQSDRGSRNSREQKWPRTPLNGTSGNADRDLSSPTVSSPESKGEVAQMKQELSRVRYENKLERQKNMELHGRIAELESTLDKKADIHKVESELQEKRSTMVVLDTQKSIVIKELEVITQHLQDAKRSGQPFNLHDMQNKILKDFTVALERLRDKYTPQIEERMQRKNDLDTELSELNQNKEKVFQEFEQLSVKNAQLADLNNQLVRQIQDLHVKVSTSEKASQHHHGLGIYTHHSKERSNVSIDSRDMAPSLADSQLTGTTIGENPPESATIVNAPQVVNIQKMQATKRLNFLGGKRAMAKGIKAAFSSNENKQAVREGSAAGLTEGVPYGAMSQGADPSVTNLPMRNADHDSSRQGFGFFGQPKSKAGHQIKVPSRSETPSKPIVQPSVLFGSELEQRAEYEGRKIPYIVTRCVEEVELRGMQVEGIYRKSGSKTQTDSVREAFQTGDESMFTDPDFDIHAVASALKQYFRSLPTSLLIFAIYDRLLEAMTLTPDERMMALHASLRELPPRHKDTLEYLIFHLARVVKMEGENKMNSANCGVVFAPTIMMSDDTQRDLANTKAKNILIAFMIENCNELFPHGKVKENGAV